MSEHSSFDRSTVLPSLRVEIWNGIIFVNSDRTRRRWRAPARARS